MASGRVFEAVQVESSGIEDDIESAFSDWKAGLDDSESPAMIRAFRIPFDESGKPSYNATGQVRLGSWPLDQYDFDTLCTKILKEFMLPTESMMAVRLIGTVKGKSGLSFNRIVTLQRPNSTTLQITGPTSNDPISAVIKQMQESNERMLRMFQEMGGKPAAGTDGNQMAQLVSMSRVMMEPMMAVMSAFAGRPLGGAGPSTSMKETLETMMLMDRFLGRRGGGGSGDGGGSDIVKVTQAVAGVAGPLLQLAVSQQAQSTRTRQIAQPPPKPAQVSTARPTQAQPSVTAPAQPSQAQPARSMESAPTQSVDLSKPSSEIASPFAPGPNIDAPSGAVGEPHMFAEMKKQVDTLIAIAQAGTDPVAVANEFYNTTMVPMEDEDYGKLAAVIENPSFMNSLRIYNAQVDRYAVWFTAFREQLVARIVAADTSDPAESAS